MAVRRGGNGIESRVERPGFLEIGTPARKRNAGVQGDSVAARGQYVGKQRTAEQRPSHFRSLLFRQSRPADRNPRFLPRPAPPGHPPPPPALRTPHPPPPRPPTNYTAAPP